MQVRRMVSKGKKFQTSRHKKERWFSSSLNLDYRNKVHVKIKSNNNWKKAHEVMILLHCEALI